MATSFFYLDVMKVTRGVSSSGVSSTPILTFTVFVDGDRSASSFASGVGVQCTMATFLPVPSKY